MSFLNLMDDMDYMKKVRKIAEAIQNNELVDIEELAYVRNKACDDRSCLKGDFAINICLSMVNGIKEIRK